MLLNDIQNAVQIFANLAVASAMGLCLVIGIAGTFNQRLAYDCQTCRLDASRKTSPGVALAPTMNTPAHVKPVAVAMTVR